MVSPRPQSASSTATDDKHGDNTEPSWPLTTWQGRHRFTTTDPPAPPQPDDPPRSTEERLAYHSSFVTIRTPAINQLATQVHTLMILGRHQQATARPSLIVTGPAAPGKPTALLDAVLEAGGGAIDGLVRTDFLEPGVAGGAGGGDHVGAQMAGELHAKWPTPPAAAVIRTR